MHPPLARKVQADVSNYLILVYETLEIVRNGRHHLGPYNPLVVVQVVRAVVDVGNLDGDDDQRARPQGVCGRDVYSIRVPATSKIQYRALTDTKVPHIGVDCKERGVGPT